MSVTFTGVTYNGQDNMKMESTAVSTEPVRKHGKVKKSLTALIFASSKQTRMFVRLNGRLVNQKRRYKEAGNAFS